KAGAIFSLVPALIDASAILRGGEQFFLRHSGGLILLGKDEIGFLADEFPFVVAGDNFGGRVAFGEDPSWIEEKNCELSRVVDDKAELFFTGAEALLGLLPIEGLKGECEQVRERGEKSLFIAFPGSWGGELIQAKNSHAMFADAKGHSQKSTNGRLASTSVT